MHSFHASTSYFLTNSSLSLYVIFFKTSVIKLSVVSVKNVFKVELNVFASTEYAIIKAYAVLPHFIAASIAPS